MVYYQKTFEDNLLVAEAEYELAKKRFLQKKKELVEIETTVVLAKENVIKAQEELRKFKSTWILTDDVDDTRLDDIEKLKEKLPDILIKIQDEKPLELFKCGEVGTKKFQSHKP